MISLGREEFRYEFFLCSVDISLNILLSIIILHRSCCLVFIVDVLEHLIVVIKIILLVIFYVSDNRCGWLTFRCENKNAVCDLNALFRFCSFVPHTEGG